MAAERRQDGRRQTEREMKKKETVGKCFLLFFRVRGRSERAEREELACVLKIGFPISQPLIFAIMLS